MDELNMRGGRLLDQGGYGCIFDPPLICRGEKAPRKGSGNKMIGKVTLPEDITSEVMAANIFKDKPEANNYFILPEIDTLCKKAPSGRPAIKIDDQKEVDLGKCRTIQDFGLKNLLHYQMKHGGVSLHKKLDSVHIAVNEFPFYKFMGQMLEIGAYMALNGVIHNDLHSGNVVVDDKYNFRLIDFGRCYTANNINEKLLDTLESVYNPRLGQVTPECTVQDGLIQKMQLPIMVNEMINGKASLIYAERIFGINRQQQMFEFTNFWKTSRSVQSGDYVKFWKLYWPATDAWGIGYILISTLYKLSLSNQFMKSSQWKEKSTLVKGVITGLLKCSPMKRIDCIEALALYDPMNALVLSASGKAWLTKKHEKRKKI
jgi:serine/threonine protein kinase